MKNVYISSSIENWREKIEKKLKGYKGDVGLFFGIYGERDLKNLEGHKGEKKIFWQGSDILNLTHERVQRVIGCENYCENKMCKDLLDNWGIHAEIKPIFWGDSKKYYPRAWICMHEGREAEYGLNEIRKIKNIVVHIYGIKRENEKNIIYHGKVSEEQLDKEIRNYQIAIRLNKFDGMSEVISKGILLGQKVISTIPYPHMDDREWWVKEFNKKIKDI